MQPKQQPLAIDIGNSGLRISLLDVPQGGIGPPLRISWSHSGEAANHDEGAKYPTRKPLETNAARRYSPDTNEWLPEVERWLDEHTSGPLLWMVSSVRSDALARLVDFAATRPQDHCQVIGFRDVPMKVAVDYPERLGIDRLLAALAAAATSDVRPMVVIQAGSAVTVDLVTRAMPEVTDCFAGGAILPGVPMMLRLLGRGADMLPEIDADELVDLPDLPGRNTEAAMRCGTASALVGGVQHLVGRYRALYGESLMVVISGGDGTRLSPFIPAPVRVEDHLVLRGLLRLLSVPRQ